MGVAGSVGLLVHSVGLAVASCTSDDDSQRGLHVMVLTDQPGGVPYQRVIDATHRSRDWLADAGVDLELADVIQLPDASPFGRVLVDFDDADAPCAAAGWRGHVEAADAVPSDGQVTLVIGGLIRSTDAARRFAGYTCRLLGDGCSTSDVDGTVVLVDGAGAERAALDVVIAHELGHALGLEHADVDVPCGAMLVPADEPRCPTFNLMDEAIHSQAFPRDCDAGAVTLDDVSLTPEQVRAISS